MYGLIFALILGVLLHQVVGTSNFNFYFILEVLGSLQVLKHAKISGDVKALNVLIELSYVLNHMFQYGLRSIYQKFGIAS